jgi:hypothetical protein
MILKISIKMSCKSAANVINSLENYGKKRKKSKRP